MRNHDEKVRDMTESVLPSTRRKAARQERRRVHKRQRARQRDLLVVARRTAGHDDRDADFREGIRRQEITQMVWGRRAADKVGPLTRWASVQVGRDEVLRDAPLTEQVDYFARLVPDNTIGRHAVQHIESDLRHAADRERWLARRAEWSADQRRRHREQVSEDVDGILAAGCHRELNDALRAGYRARATVGEGGAVILPRPNRLLLGAHDVDDFADAVAGYGWIRDVVHTLRLVRVPQ
ncbi:hypothetical protein [Frankia nepalensis]|uniref:Uncharacterized protein n=2 Tax=Frankia nepalensis TaxID=1836974 RepID=A0A937RUX0_9ACTN|nr:hypothetical protein [Frankia nepalensis]MBL7500488.1 hypothetical protein [Frankia nepalensis]MBL7511232.1 hypothetical protein [Frankia nepalensis]MBL7632336.1 hypothetical protein [Frankia nepalensis]